MLGLHRGAFVAACAVAVGALVALVFLPARAGAATADGAAGVEHADDAASAALMSGAGAAPGGRSSSEGTPAVYSGNSTAPVTP
jgi:hypothetical protein